MPHHVLRPSSSQSSADLHRKTSESLTLWRIVRAAICAVFVMLCAAAGFAQTGGDTFTNPLMDSGPDPWVIQWKGFYYYMNSTGVNLTLWKTRALSPRLRFRKSLPKRNFAPNRHAKYSGINYYTREPNTYTIQEPFGGSSGSPV